MKLDFESMEENGGGKIFAVLEEEQLPVGQLFYKVDHQNKNLLVDYVYIPRKYWREGGIREQLIAELQNMHPDYSFSMKENQKQAHLLSEVKTSMPQGIPHVKTGLEIIKRFAENFVPPKTSEEKTTIYPEGYWWRVRDLFKDPEFNNFMQEYQIDNIGQMERLLRAAVKQGILIKDAAGSHATNSRFDINFYESDYIYAPYKEKYEAIPEVKEEIEKQKKRQEEYEKYWENRFEEMKKRKEEFNIQWEQEIEKRKKQKQNENILPSAKQKHEEYWTEYFNRTSKWKKEAPARSKAQFRYMQGICNGSIEPPKGMTRAQACEYVEGQKDYKKLPDKKSIIENNFSIKSSFDEDQETLFDPKKYDERWDWLEGLNADRIKKRKAEEYMEADEWYFLIQDDAKSGLNPYEIAEKRNLPVEIINDILEGRRLKRQWDQNRLNDFEEGRIKRMQQNSEPDQDRLYIQKRKQKIIGDIVGGMSVADVARKYRIHRNDVKTILTQNNIPIPDHRKFNPWKLRRNAKNSLHKNIHTGEPCSCGFYRPEEEKLSSWKQVIATKLEKIIKDDPKVLRTEEGQKVLEWMKSLPENVDDLLPWMVREYKKQRLVPLPNQAGEVQAMRGGPNSPNFDFDLDAFTLGHWADWFNSNSPTRRGVDIMQLTTEELADKVAEWDEELSANMEEAQVFEGSGEVVYAYPDGWSMREVSAEECSSEGQQMGHCVGGGGYADAIRRGQIKILSLRDPENNPHATLEVRSDGSVVQIQGKQNVHPIGKYRKRIRQFIIDPDGFKKLMGTDPRKPSDRRNYVDRWDEFSQLPTSAEEEELILPEIDEEEEFDPKWDVGVTTHNVPEGHPAGRGGYDLNYRPEHYGIYPPRREEEPELSIGGILATMPFDVNQRENLDRLYQYADQKGLLSNFPSGMDQALRRLDRDNIKLFPNFNDESRGGWRDIFEKITGTHYQDPQYEEKWNNWVSNLWSQDIDQLAKDLTYINGLDDPRYKEEDRRNVLFETIKNQLSLIKNVNYLQNLLVKRPDWNPDQFGFDQKRQDFSDLRTRWERGLQNNRGSLPPEASENQISLFSSKWKKSSKWKTSKKKIAMPKDPSDLDPSEVVTTSFVKHKRYLALRFGFKKGMQRGIQMGRTNIGYSIGTEYPEKRNIGWEHLSPYSIQNSFNSDRKIHPNQTVIPFSFDTETFHKDNEWWIKDLRINLNDVIDIIPSKFLSGGRKYTPEGKQFSKKKFIETLIQDFYKSIDIGAEKGYALGQEMAYSRLENSISTLGPEERSRWEQSARDDRRLEEEFDNYFMNMLKETDVETFGYVQEREEIFDKFDWGKIFEEKPEIDATQRWWKKIDNPKQLREDSKDRAKRYNNEELEDIINYRIEQWKQHGR